MSFDNYDAFLLWWKVEIHDRWDEWTPTPKTIQDWYTAFRKVDKDHLADAVQKHMIADSLAKPKISRVREHLKAMFPGGLTEHEPVKERGVIYQSFTQWTQQAPTTRTMDFRKLLAKLLPSRYPKIDPEAASLVEADRSQKKEQVMSSFAEPTGSPKPKRKFDECPELDDTPF